MKNSLARAEGNEPNNSERDSESGHGGGLLD